MIKKDAFQLLDSIYKSELKIFELNKELEAIKSGEAEQVLKLKINTLQAKKEYLLRKLDLRLKKSYDQLDELRKIVNCGYIDVMNADGLPKQCRYDEDKTIEHNDGFWDTIEQPGIEVENYTKKQ